MSSIKARVRDKMLSFIDAHRLLDNLTTIIVGFSGGPDSTALLILLNEMFEDTRAVHLHHGLRGKDADADEEWCANFCAKKQIPYCSSTLNVPGNRISKESMETASRRLRINYWARYFEDKPNAALALGHHLDDKVENFFIRLFRGSNTTGLTGLRASTMIRGVQILRPLLCLEKKEIIAYLTECNIQDYCIDKSNANLRYYRNKIRHSVVPSLVENSGSKQGLLKSLEYMEHDAEIIEHHVRKSVDKTAGEAIPTPMLLEMPSSLWPRFLRTWMNTRYGVENLPVRGTLIKNLRDNLSRPITGSKRFEISSSFFLRVNETTTTLEPKHQPGLSKAIIWEWIQTSNLAIPDIKMELVASIVKDRTLCDLSELNSEYWDPQTLGDTLIIRPRQAGDRMIPFGVSHEVRVKKLVANAKLASIQKQQLIVITNTDGKILWIPFVRRANFGKVSNFGDVAYVKLTIRRMSKYLR